MRVRPEIEILYWLHKSKIVLDCQERYCRTDIVVSTFIDISLESLAHATIADAATIIDLFFLLRKDSVEFFRNNFD